MANFEGKEIYVNGKWYPLPIKAANIKEAQKIVKGIKKPMRGRLVKQF